MTTTTATTIRYYERVAEHNATCPICSRYIRAGRSRIAPLDVAMPPDPATLHFSRGTFVRLDGTATRLRPSSWAHADCLHRAGDHEAQVQLADERRDELKQMRRDGDHDRRSPTVRKRGRR
jgi:hypothetical protein